MKDFCTLFLSAILGLTVAQSFLSNPTDLKDHKIPAIEARELEDCKFIWRTDSRKSKLPHRKERGIPNSQIETPVGQLSAVDSITVPSTVAPISPRWTVATGWAHVWLFGLDDQLIGHSNTAIIGAEFDIPAGKVSFKRMWVDKYNGRQFGFFLPQVIVNGRPKGQCYDCHEEVVEGKYDECVCIFRCSGPRV